MEAKLVHLEGYMKIDTSDDPMLGMSLVTGSPIDDRMRDVVCLISPRKINLGKYPHDRKEQPAFTLMFDGHSAPRSFLHPVRHGDTLRIATQDMIIIGRYLGLHEYLAGESKNYWVLYLALGDMDYNPRESETLR